jgi:hypothetical protein
MGTIIPSIIKKYEPETSLVLRVCRSDMSSRAGFSWSAVVGAEVSAFDWDNNTECGNGLHGWLYGHGDPSCINYWEEIGAKWMVLEVLSADIVMLDGKCKFPSAVVRFVGTKAAAADFILANEPKSLGAAVICASLKAGDGGVVQVSGLGTATAGVYGIAMAGFYGTATAGNYGTATAGERGTAKAGEKGTATAGFYGTATAGNGGTATVGNYGTAIAGERGTATAGYWGTAKVGSHGELRIQYWDIETNRCRTALGYVGENGIKANTAYQLNDKHEFEEVKL